MGHRFGGASGFVAEVCAWHDLGGAGYLNRMTDERLLSSKQISSCDRLIFALDLPSSEEALRWVDLLGDSVSFYKLGFQLFMAEGYWTLVEKLLSRGKKIFVDLKFFDVPETVKNAVANLSRRGVECCTVHGSQSILAGAVDSKGAMKVLAVTVLTSLDRGDLDDLGFQCSVEDLVFSRAKRALEIGCDGVISSGMEAARLRQELGERLLIVTPGIRPVENRIEDDQKRVMTLEQAFMAGADHVVVGRPIRQAADPREKAAEMQDQIRRLFARGNQPR
jgi:orotidine-5'-phosphate decarboxylase